MYFTLFSIVENTMDIETLQAFLSLKKNALESSNLTIDWSRTKKDKKYALLKFYEIWGFDTANSTKNQKISMIKFLNTYYEKLSDFKTNKELNQKFYEFFAKDKLYKPKTTIDLKILNFDIPGIIKLIEKKEIQDAYQKLIEQKGIGPKVASMFIRDVSLNLCKHTEYTTEELIYMFPVDIWVREICNYLVDKNNIAIPQLILIRPPKMENNDLKLRKAICSICIKHNIDPRILNKCMWYFGSHIAGNTNRLKKVLQIGKEGIISESKLMEVNYKE